MIQQLTFLQVDVQEDFRFTKTLFSYLILILLFTSCVESDDPVNNQLNSEGKKVGTWVYADSLELDTLKIEFYTDQSILYREVNFQKGKRIFDTYYENGSLKKVIRFYTHNGMIKSVTDYINGKKIHKETWHSNGNKFAVANYSGEELTGEFRQYYPNGQLEFEIDNVRNGKATLYDSLGSRLFLLQFEDYQSVDTLRIY